MDKKQEFNVSISIDDVNPLTDWRIIGDRTEKYLFDLNKQFGCKFTLFIPANYHGKAKLSNNLSWVDELVKSNIFELAAHGYYHKTSNQDQFGEMEFLDIAEFDCASRIQLMMREWESVGIIPIGWKNPGWMCQSFCVPLLSQHFKWAMLHPLHNSGLKWNLKEIYNAIGIHETELSISDNNIIFQSHIFGDWNSNTWNDKNYNQLTLSLQYLTENFNVSFKTISEL